MDISNELHNEYVYHTSVLIAEMFNIDIPIDAEKLCLNEQSNYKVDKYIPSNEMKIAATDAEEKENEKNKYINIDESLLPNNTELQNFEVKVIPFEKDDDKNHHIDYITATSNIRASNYRIDKADKYTTKLIAGKIIPAISTTTSIVSGLVTIEMIKNIFGKKNIQEYKNSFINLALSFTLLSEPMPTIKNKIGNETYTPWDYYNLEEDLKVEKLFERLTNFYEIEIDTLMFGSKMLISPMTGFSQKSKRMNMKISELLKSNPFNVVLESKIYELQISSLLNENEDEVDFPNIKFHYILEDSDTEQEFV
jgi:ubiquitin-activating enzyme E1